MGHQTVLLEIPLSLQRRTYTAVPNIFNVLKIIPFITIVQNIQNFGVLAKNSQQHRFQLEKYFNNQQCTIAAYYTARLYHEQYNATPPPRRRFDETFENVHVACRESVYLNNIE